MDFIALPAILILIGIVVFLLLLNWAVPVRLWIEAIFSRVPLGLGSLVGMRLRKVSPPSVVRPLIASTKAGLPLEVAHLEAHYLAGGNVDRVVRALISADKASIDLPFQQAAAIDLAGRDVFEAVQVSVNPKVVQTPRVAAMARDGIQLIAVARVTVRANINRLVGGAGEETILARVGEGIVSTIGSADTHKAVLENPDAISKTVLQKGLDSGTAFEILSIDIGDGDEAVALAVEPELGPAGLAEPAVEMVRVLDMAGGAGRRNDESATVVGSRRAVGVHPAGGRQAPCHRGRAGCKDHVEPPGRLGGNPGARRAGGRAPA